MRANTFINSNAFTITTRLTIKYSGVGLNQIKSINTKVVPSQRKQEKQIMNKIT
jgi:hypothetical protein